MPGLSGFVSNDAALDSPDEMRRRFEEVHTLENVTFVQKSFQNEHCVITNHLTGLWTTAVDQPAFDPTGNTLLLLEGQIFNAEALARRLHEDKPRTYCEILLALFLEQGLKFLEWVDGEFNIVIYQQAEKRLTILNDRFASRPMYYMKQDNGLLFGSEQKSILAVCSPQPALDPVGLLELVAYAHNVAGRTMINALHCLPPASHLEFQGGELHVRRYMQMVFPQRPWDFRADPLIEAGQELFRAGTVRRLKEAGRVAIGLSGGLDSRAIACAIPRDWRPMAARTRGNLASGDVSYAIAIANRLGFDLYHEEPSEAPLSATLHQIVWRMECATQFNFAMTVPNHMRIKQYSDFMSGGWLGGVSSGQLISEYMFLPNSRRQFVDKFYRRYTRIRGKALPILFQPDFLNQHLPAMQDAFLDSFTTIESPTNWEMAQTWFALERTPRLHFALAAVDSHLFEFIRPFLNWEYHAFMMTLPLALRYGQPLYQSIIYHLGPEIRDIPSANTELKLRKTIAGNSLNRVISRQQKVQSKLLSKLSPAMVKQSKPEPEDLEFAIRQDAELHHMITSFLDSDNFDAAIFNKAGILSILNQHYQGAANHSDTVALLATLAVGLPTFVYHRPRRV